MPIIDCYAKDSRVSYSIYLGKRGSLPFSAKYSLDELDIIAVSLALNEFANSWQKELDARQYEQEGGEIAKVAEPSRFTKRELPPPIEVRSSNEKVVKWLGRQHHIGNKDIFKLAQTVWNQCSNLNVKFRYIPKWENEAAKEYERRL